MTNAEQKSGVERNVQGPFCECGECDATGRGGGKEIRLPASAWSVAGHGDLNALAVRKGHEKPYEGAEYALVYHENWVEVREAS